MPDHRKLTVAGIIVAAIGFIAVNIWAALDLRGINLDLTENRQFTLSEGTASLLRDMDEPITLRLYVSGELREASPFYASFADRVADMLHAYSDLAGGMLEVLQIDPEPFSVEEDRAVGFGLQAIPLDTAGNVAYLGIAGTNSTDDVDVMPVLVPEREMMLEYDLTRMVFNLANPEKPVAAVLSSLPLNGDPAMQYQPWKVWTQLQQFFELRYLGGEVATIDEDVDILLLVHPKELPQEALYAIDQAVMRGVRLLAFIDPHSEAELARAGQGGAGPARSDLATLLEPWGVRLAEGKFAGDPHAARQVTFPVQGREQIVDYLAWLSFGPEALAAGEVAVADLQRINVATAGFFEKIEGAEIRFTPLLTTSAESMAMDVSAVQGPPDPLKLISAFSPGAKPLTVAARVTGAFVSAFGDAPPEAIEPELEHVSQADGERTVILVADTDILEDRMWISSQRLLGQDLVIPVADNADLLANLMDFLVGSETLMSLRGRDVAIRPFTKITEIRLEAEQRYRAKEQALLQELEEVQGKIDSLRITDGEEATLLGSEQQEAIEGFKKDLLATRSELRQVQRALREDIDSLHGQVRFASIAAVPLIIAIAALLLAAVRRRRFRRRIDVRTT